MPSSNTRSVSVGSIIALVNRRTFLSLSSATEQFVRANNKCVI